MWWLLNLAFSKMRGDISLSHSSHSICNYVGKILSVRSMSTNAQKYSLEYLSIEDTNVLKGLAIILMLVHHLFWNQNELYDEFGSIHLFYLFGCFAKLCVVLFVFLSGYGLMIQTEKKGGIGSLKEFYFHRFKKLYLNYWFIWLVFVPISYFCFEYTFQNAYHSNVGWHLIADIIGLHSIIFSGSYCYNPTWWFYSCIIVLYLLYPLMYKMMKRDSLSLLLLTLIISFLPIPFFSDIQFNIIAFSLGMLLATSKNAPPPICIRSGFYYCS